MKYASCPIGVAGVLPFGELKAKPRSTNVVCLLRARWSNMIHDEWIRNVHANCPDLSLERLERTRAQMNHAVRDCVVTGFEYMIPSISLPDPDDRHVVAAAIHSGASLIITFNLKDFPDEALKPYNLAAQHPDDFIVDLLDLHPAGVLEAAASHRRSLKSPAIVCTAEHDDWDSLRLTSLRFASPIG
jgi:hypothetical protein